MSSWSVYLLKCADQTIYTGMTNNLSRRIAHHNRGFGAKYTRGRGPVTLLKFFPCASKSEALKLEARIKKLSRHQKLAFQLDISQPTPSKKDLTMKNDFTAIAVVLDASGSMSGITDDTIGSFNQFLAEQKALPGEAAFTLCVFNTDYRLVHDFQPLASVANLTNKTYRPMGGTALLDAMGTTIDSLGARLAAMPEDQRPDADRKQAAPARASSINTSHRPRQHSRLER